MPYRETPDVLEVNTVAAEMTDTAVIEGGSVLFCASIVLFPVYLDTVNIFAEPAPVEAQTGNAAAERAGHIDHAVAPGVTQMKSRRAVVAEAPSGDTAQRDPLPHPEFADDIIAGRNEHRSMALFSVSKRAFKCRGRISDAIWDSAVVGHFEFCHEKSPLS